MEDKIFGMFIGSALGDALGAPHEFSWQKNNVYTGELYLPLSLRVGSYFNRQIVKGVIGQITDDTEMRIIILRNMIKYHGYNKKNIIIDYLNWANNVKYPCMGKNTRSLFKGIKTIRGYYNRINKQKKLPSDDLTQSNGSLMRCCPLVFESLENIKYDCELTNLSPICIETNIIYLKILRHILTGKKMEPLNIKHEIIQKIYDQAVKGIKIDIDNKQKGWVLYGLYCSIYVWKHCKSFKEGIDYIIKLGGDTDTNASIAGALLGAKHGYKQIYNENKKNINIMMNADPNLGQIHRNKKYTMNNISILVKKFCNLYC